MQLLGAPQRLVAAASERRRIAGSPGVDIISDAIVPLIQRQAVETYDQSDGQPFAGWKAGVSRRKPLERRSLNLLAAIAALAQR